jgi:hypothetical protein
MAEIAPARRGNCRAAARARFGTGVARAAVEVPMFSIPVLLATALSLVSTGTVFFWTREANAPADARDR